MKKTLIALLALVTITAPAQAQYPEYPVVLVELTEQVKAPLRAAYAPGAPQAERLFCAVNWETESRGEYTLLRITKVEELVRKSTATKITTVGGECLTKDHVAQPSIHTHPVGICQASPADMRNMMQRMAPADGVACGPEQVAWYFPKQLLTVINAALQQQLAEATP